MNIELLYSLISKSAGAANVLANEPMKAHTTFRIGGPADLFVTPGSEEAVRDVICACRQNSIPFTVIGNGSNLLVGDRGIRGVVIQIGKSFSDMEVRESEDDPEKGIIHARAGAMLSAVSRKAWQAGLKGLAFASGIPGSLGGAVMMNAGAYGGEMKQVVRSVRVLTRDNEILEIPGAEMGFGYRTSIVEKEGFVVLGAVMELAKGDAAQIFDEMEKLKEQRTSKQPLDKPSAGSAFKRPEGYFAGKLIMDAGLRGFSVGDAAISEKHCGFVINKGDATAAEVRALMEQVQQKVMDQFGVKLEPEIRFLGEF